MNLFDIKWIEVFDTIIRAILSLTVLFLTAKLLGKKQVSQLSLFDYVIGISIGNFAAEMTINMDSQYANGLTAIIVFGLVAYLVSFITMKSITLRRFFIGTPTILIQNGKIIEKNLRKVNFDINDMLEECRGNGYFDISQIEYALMEANGKLSILLKGEYLPVTMKDMKLKVEKQELVANVIIDGKIMRSNLENMKKDEKWLNQELKVKGYQTLNNILLGTLDNNDKLVIYERNYHEKIHNVLE